ncbi:hypothetical protein PCK1_001391 [Pneumocystis canis]|nr:hypothetical protein PCK1_001391 [Pneumocystis canis]
MTKFNNFNEKLSIYSEIEDDPISIEIPPSNLQLKIQQGRKQFQKTVQNVTENIEKVINKWIHIENKIENIAKELAPSNGEILSGGIYVLIAGMSGLILTRKRIFPIRFITPAVTSLAASTYFFPETHKNLRHMIWKHNQNYFVNMINTKHDKNCIS